MTELAASDLNAKFDYLRDPPTDDPSISIQYYSEDREKTTMRLLPVETPVVDGRGREFSVDREGFELVRHHCSITDYLDRSQTDVVYPAEMSVFIRQLTGAHTAFATGTNVRFGNGRGDYAQTSDHKPARFPHGDFTDESAKRMLEIGGDALPSYSRWAIFNTWRVFSDPPQDFPLALCDARSVTPDDEDAVQIFVQAPNRDPISNMSMVYYPNPAHRWTYFSNMTVDEVLIFKSFDSDAARPRRVAHSAFANPLATPDWPSRRSIETRVVALFD